MATMTMLWEPNVSLVSSKRRTTGLSWGSIFSMSVRNSILGAKAPKKAVTRATPPKTQMGWRAIQRAVRLIIGRSPLPGRRS